MIPKFRAWEKDNKQMFKVSCMLFTDCLKGFEVVDWKKKLIEVHFRNGETPKSVILMQSTGLKDRNGKEIFEGDIVKLAKIGIGSIVFMDKAVIDHEYGIIETLPAFLIKWYDDNEACSFIQKGEDCKVIGNIHENPELLKEKKK